VATRLVEALAINSITEKTRRGRRVIVKRRNLHSQQLADLTNLYFRMADIPIRFWSKVEEWLRWEVGCFEMLNGDRYRAYASGTRCVIVEKLPGESLWIHLNQLHAESAGRTVNLPRSVLEQLLRGCWSTAWHYPECNLQSSSNRATDRF
jgi:hypothetical protein